MSMITAGAQRPQTSSDPQTGPRSPRFLIFNFFAGVLERGIPRQAQNLREALERQGIACREVRCPAMLRKLPRPMLNLLFVGWEQIIMPVMGLGYDRTIHPYNSVSILGSVMGKSVVIVQDFVPMSRRNTKFSARYIRATQRIHAWLRRDVIYEAQNIARIGRTLGCFPWSRTYVFPNAFYCFMDTLRLAQPPRGEHVLLCTGWGSNKDLPGALELYCESGLCKKRALRILGIAGHQETVDAFLQTHPELRERITVLPRLEDVEVGDAYRAAAWVWVHSKREGYGRPIAEAKLCGCRIVASDIAPFREQRDEMVFLYSGLERFVSAWARCEESPAEIAPREPKEHALLHDEVERFLRVNRLRTGAAAGTEDDREA
jgi:glycosyltransferase involved in cell wall biosynthesis